MSTLIIIVAELIQASVYPPLDRGRRQENEVWGTSTTPQ